MNGHLKSARIIRLPELVEKVGYARSTIYALIKKGRFPPPFKLTPGGRANGWMESTIDDFLIERAKTSTQKKNNAGLK